ncbi:hypothetical protein MMIC_P2361 [Mariprofundus micogutta]|uniref:Uncharacterized protein n=2 Tax=Mariprofundus micogutta TaxID=1921010 RepID=A0A1L8CR51_9PROT|nr:hypothetical protein MMIC_P2361 [Mariprofundus micogutta]
MAPWGANQFDEKRYHRIESFRAVNIQVEHESKLHADEYDQPDYMASIEMKGRPSGGGFNATSAQLCFYPDGDVRITKPSYDEKKQRISISYPISMFEKQVELLTTHYELECTYLESHAQLDRNAFIQGCRRMPEQLH